MRYSSAVVLSTIVVGLAAAANLHNRHAGFHARRQAGAKGSGGHDVDWSKVAYDLGDVDWNTVFPNPTATATPTVESPAQVNPEPETTPYAAKEPAPKEPAKEPTPEEPAEEPTPYAAAEKPTPTSSSAKPTATATSSDPLGDLVDDITDAVSEFLDGVEEWVEKLKCKSGLNKQKPWDGIWIGGDSKWKAEFINDRSNEDMLLFCWQAHGFSGMSINVNAPDISVKIPAGKSIELSFKEHVPSACAPVYGDTGLAIFGGVNNTWFEVTFGEGGCFDVSRNIKMAGDSISSKGSKCVSDMETCVFKCKNGLDTCESGADYDLFNCNESGGGGGGYDPIMAGTGGGCSMGQDKEHIKVVIS